jgi:hypothetical protein
MDRKNTDRPAQELSEKIRVGIERVDLLTSFLTVPGQACSRI